jgi:hypothetical protein
MAFRVLVAISRLGVERRSPGRAAIGFQNGFMEAGTTQYFPHAIVGPGHRDTSFELRAAKSTR